MTRKAVQFLRGFGAYNAAETACFDADRADELIAQKVAVEAREQPPAADTITVSVGIDPRETEAFKEATAEIAQAARKVQDRGAALDRREADLAARAEDLDRRAAEIEAREAAAQQVQSDGAAAGADDGAGAEGASESDKATAKAAGLPKQGR